MAAEGDRFELGRDGDLASAARPSGRDRGFGGEVLGVIEQLADVPLERQLVASPHEVRTHLGRVVVERPLVKRRVREERREALKDRADLGRALAVAQHFEHVELIRARVREPPQEIERRLDCDRRSRDVLKVCLLYTSPSPRDGLLSRMPSSA